MPCRTCFDVYRQLLLQQVADELSCGVRKTLDAIAGAVLSDDAWAQACLPLGPGLGLLPVQIAFQVLLCYQLACICHWGLGAVRRDALRSGQFVGSTAGVAAAEARALVTEANKAQLAESCCRTLMSRLVTMHKADTLAVLCRDARKALHLESCARDLSHHFFRAVGTNTDLKMNSLEFSVSLCHYLDMRLPVYAPNIVYAGKLLMRSANT